MTLDGFLPFILPEVLDCPDPTVRARLLLVAAEFCRSTLSWTEIQDPVALVNDQADYEIDKPSDAYTYTVRDVTCGNRKLTPLPRKDLLSDGWSNVQSNEPVYFNAATERGFIRIFPTPANVTDQTLVIRAAYVPTISATTLPDFLGQQYMDVIASGVKAHLMLMPGTSWENPALSAFYKKKFDDGVVNARIEEAHDRVPGTLRVSPRRFGF
jgi:hypothetical protein